MNIGSLDRELTLQQPAPAPADEFGGAGQVRTFTDIGPVACRREFKPGGEAVQAAQNTATQRVVFTIRYYPDVLPTWQLVFEGRTYQITDVAEVGRRRATLLSCYAHG
jgi:SPP1 family predicted phage head-tail adaptor